MYGCDVCQEVCPWNTRRVVSACSEWQPQPALDAPTLLALWEASDAELDAIRGRGPMTRVSTPDLRRNLAIAIGNADGLVPATVLDAGADGDPARPSLEAPGVIDAIDWARRRLTAREGAGESGQRPLDPDQPRGSAGRMIGA